MRRDAVTLLEEIRELRGLAQHGEIWIDEWRRRNAALRAAGPEQSPRDRIEAARRKALTTWVERSADEEETGTRCCAWPIGLVRR